MTSEILLQRRAGVGVITLNRPEALNALNLSMLRTLYRTLLEWRDDLDVKAIVLRGNGRAFCAGGDIKAVVAERQDAAFLDEVYRVEYHVDRVLHEFGRPVVALIHGATMGGGCGLSLHVSHPVAAENLVLAMPETAIGFFPDIAGSVFLHRCPGNTGLYMALTGTRIGAAEAARFGLVKAIVPLERHDALVERIVDGANIDEAIRDLSVLPDTQGPAIRHRDSVDAVFFGKSAAKIVSRLRALGTSWSQQTLENLEGQCPFSLEITSRVYDSHRTSSVADALAFDFRVAWRMTLRGDYQEGVRARLVNRDMKPAWQPRSLEAVRLEEVESCFVALDGPELWDSLPG